MQRYVKVTFRLFRNQQHRRRQDSTWIKLVKLLMTVPNVQCQVPSESFEPFPSQGRHGAQSRMPWNLQTHSNTLLSHAIQTSDQNIEAFKTWSMKKMTNQTVLKCSWPSLRTQCSQTVRCFKNCKHSRCHFTSGCSTLRDLERIACRRRQM